MTSIQAVSSNDVIRVFTALSRVWLNLTEDPDVSQNMPGVQRSMIEVVFPASAAMKDEEFITFIHEGFMLRLKNYQWFYGVRWLDSRLLSVETKVIGSTYLMLFELAYVPDA